MEEVEHCAQVKDLLEGQAGAVGRDELGVVARTLFHQGLYSELEGVLNLVILRRIQWAVRATIRASKRT